MGSTEACTCLAAPPVANLEELSVSTSPPELMSGPRPLSVAAPQSQGFPVLGQTCRYSTALILKALGNFSSAHGAQGKHPLQSLLFHNMQDIHECERCLPVYKKSATASKVVFSKA